MILLSHLFDTSFGQIAVGMMRSNYVFNFPCTFDLFHGEKNVVRVVAQSVVLDNNYSVFTMKGKQDEDFLRISFTLSERIEKSLVEGRHDAYLLEPSR